MYVPCATAVSVLLRTWEGTIEPSMPKSAMCVLNVVRLLIGWTVWNVTKLCANPYVSSVLDAIACIPLWKLWPPTWDSAQCQLVESASNSLWTWMGWKNTKKLIERCKERHQTRKKPNEKGEQNFTVEYAYSRSSPGKNYSITNSLISKILQLINQYNLALTSKMKESTTCWKRTKISSSVPTAFPMWGLTSAFPWTLSSPMINGFKKSIIVWA